MWETFLRAFPRLERIWYGPKRKDGYQDFADPFVLVSLGRLKGARSPPIAGFGTPQGGTDPAFLSHGFGTRPDRMGHVRQAAGAGET